jgi:type VI protein secretion system component VasF
MVYPMPASIQHYRVRLRRSRRLPYRIVRLLLLALAVGLLLLVYIVAGR